MMAGEAAMVVALADSFFFDVDLDAARSRILLFLLISFTPFLVIAPLIGPVIDRIRGGRRFVVQLVAAIRILLQILMIQYSDELLLFPLVFVALVLQKTYTVSKSALVPSVVRGEQELVEANSKLGLIAGVTGAVAVLPAGLLQLVFGTGATLAYGAVLFAVALVAATQLPREVVIVSTTGPQGGLPQLPSQLRAASDAMFMLRCCMGFLLFQLAFWYRSMDAGTIWFGLAVAFSTVGTMGGNILGPRLRSRASEEQMLLASLTIPAVAGVAAAAFGGRAAGIVLIVLVNFAAGIARLGFESMVQRDARVVNRGQVFARFETRFQLGWVGAATVPVIITFPGQLGYLMVTALALVGIVLARSRGLSAARPPRLSAR
jgi:MFS family permease